MLVLPERSNVRYIRFHLVLWNRKTLQIRCMVYQTFNVKHGLKSFSLWRWHNIKLLLKDLIIFCNLKCYSFSCNLSYCLGCCVICCITGVTLKFRRNGSLSFPPNPLPMSLVLNQKSSTCFGFRELCVQAHSWRYGAAVMVTSYGKGEFNELKSPTKPPPHKKPLGIKGKRFILFSLKALV